MEFHMKNNRIEELVQLPARLRTVKPAGAAIAQFGNGKDKRTHAALRVQVGEHE
jgi:hypothetical protein